MKSVHHIFLGRLGELESVFSNQFFERSNRNMGSIKISLTYRKQRAK